MGQTWPATCFTKYSFIEPQSQSSFSYLLWLFCAALTDLNNCDRPYSSQSRTGLSSRHLQKKLLDPWSKPYHFSYQSIAYSLVWNWRFEIFSILMTETNILTTSSDPCAKWHNIPYWESPEVPFSRHYAKETAQCLSGKSQC